MSINVKGVAHIGICVSSIEKSLKLYKDVLGFEIVDGINRITDDEEGRGHGFSDVKGFSYKHCSLKIGDGNLIQLVEFVNPKGISNRVEGIISQNKYHIAYEVNDIDAWVRKITAAGYQLVYKILPYDKGLWCYFYDEDGMILELIQEGAAVLGEESIKLHHIGYTVTDMDKALDFFENALGMEPATELETLTDAAEQQGLGYPEFDDITWKVIFLKTKAGQLHELLEYIAPKKVVKAPPTLLNTVGKHHIAFEVGDMISAHDALVAGGCEPFYKPLRDGTLYWAHLKDFDGTAFELIQN